MIFTDFRFVPDKYLQQFLLNRIYINIRSAYNLTFFLFIVTYTAPPVYGTETAIVPTYSNYDGYKHLAGGLCCGLSALGAGLCIGIVGDAGVRANAQKDIYVGMILILIFAEALGLYGLIVAIILSS